MLNPFYVNVLLFHVDTLQDAPIFTGTIPYYLSLSSYFRVIQFVI